MNKKVAKIIGTISAALLLTGCAFGQTQMETSKNLLQNPGFEGGVTGGSRKTHWSNSFTQEITETTIARSGKKAMMIDTRVQNKPAFVVQPVNNIVGGAEYEFAVWARAVPGAKKASGVPMKAVLKIELYSPHGGNIAYWSKSFPLPEDGSWQQLKIRQRFLSSVTMCKLLLRASNPNAVIYDDASLTMTSEPPELRVLTPTKSVANAGTPTAVTYKMALLQPWKGAALPQITAHAAPKDAAAGIGKSYDLPTKVTKVDDLHFNAEVQIPALDATDYSVSLELQRDGKSYRTPYPAYLFTVLDTGRPQYLMDNGTLLWHGKPFFPIGMYHPTAGVGTDPEAGYKLLAESGFNAIQGGSTTSSPAKFKSGLDRAEKYGLAVDVPLYAGRKVKANLAGNLAAIKQFADHPAILCWKIFDEPQWKSIDGGAPGEIPAAYRAIKAADPNHPIELTIVSKGFEFWENFCDLVQTDVYPLPRNPVSLVSEHMENAREATSPWKNLSVVLQCGWSKDLSNQPTAEQARCMVYQALIHGAKGIWWYSMHEGRGKSEWRLAESPLWPHFKDINAEVKVLSMPIMLGEDVTVKSSNPKVQASAKKYQNKLYVLFTNPNKEEEKTELSITGIKGLKEGTLLEAKGKVAAADQKIVLALEPLQTDTLIFDLD